MRAGGLPAASSAGQPAGAGRAGRPQARVSASRMAAGLYGVGGCSRWQRPFDFPIPKAAAGVEDSAIAAALSVGRTTVERTRRRFVEEGLGALEERPRPGTLPKLDAKAQARLIAKVCSAAPEGRQRWTLQLLADRVVALGLAASYSYESVRRVLKKQSLSRG